MNKKAQVESFSVMILFIFIIAMFLFLWNSVFSGIYSGFEEALVTSSGNDSLAVEAIRDIQDAENSSWDYGILAIFIAYLIAMLILSFSTPVSAIFYWIYVIASMGSFIVGMLMSAIWQTWVVDPAFTTTLARFPITNTLLGTYFPMVITGIFFLILIVLFGKRPTQL